jgi:hypothetical protein
MRQSSSHARRVARTRPQPIRRHRLPLTVRAMQWQGRRRPHVTATWAALPPGAPSRRKVTSAVLPGRAVRRLLRPWLPACCSRAAGCGDATQQPRQAWLTVILSTSAGQSAVAVVVSAAVVDQTGRVAGGAAAATAAAAAATTIAGCWPVVDANQEPVAGLRWGVP